MRALIALTLFVLAACTQLNKPSTAATDNLEEAGIHDLQQGNIASANDKLSKVLTTSPQRWRSLNAMGILHSLKKEFPLALASFAAADNASPNNPAVLNNWGLALAMDNSYDEAIAKLMDAVEAASPQQRTQPEMNLALVYALSGNEKSAELILHRYMEPDKIKENMQFYRSLRGNQDKSRQVLQKAYGMPPADDASAPSQR